MHLFLEGENEARIGTTVERDSTSETRNVF